MEQTAEQIEWNSYWNGKNRGGILYAFVAEFYRKVIIRPNLNHFLKKYFKKGQHLLHAGCGSGQVDEQIATHFHITGMDISTKALELYRQSNPHGATLNSSIFSIDLPDYSVDGVYNLGVMEHFSEEQLKTSLKEIKRVVKPDGKVVFFWPPEYGLSVLFFKFMKGFYKIFLRKDVKFHPDEISRVQSKKWVTELLNQNGFEIVEYSFGARDLFTYAIIVGKKESL